MSTREEVFEFSKMVINTLQLMGFFEGKLPKISGFDVVFSEGFDLAEKNYAAAFYVGGEGVPAIVLKKGFSLGEPDDLHCLVHESIHIAQVMKGDYVYSVNGQVLWKGEIYQSLDGAHPDYFDEYLQPWEFEVKEITPKVIAQLAASIAI
ncbi:hypothetical protein [Vogesella indigofera]|uniref:hypothetical protein n=1 Tax=Vogesella indigofera TaxID=45465 RepID=UPI00234E3DCD|nr:hypothetical protein [Vogesella indigofera]MDC7708661.1 hypothetical protein [Vogesella indigofera]